MSSKTKREFGYQPYPETPWWQVWGLTMTRPSVTTFEYLNDDPNAQKDKIYGWVFWAGMLATLVWVLILMAQNNGVMVLYYCYLPLGAVLPTLMFTVGSFVAQAVAQVLGGTGSQRDFRYVYSGIYAPLMLINLVLTGVTLSSSLALINAALLVYQLVLTAIALKVINRSGWTQAIVATICQGVLNAGILYLLMRGMLAAVTRNY
jgi:hypothetical protein